MNIKWKTTLEISGLLIVIIVITNIFINISVSGLLNEETSGELKNYSMLGMLFLDSNYPGDWRLDGEDLYKGDTLINGQNEVLDQFSKETGFLATIFAEDTRISTTVTDENGSRQVGTKASEAVIDKVLKDGGTYQGTAPVAGSDADTYYIPLRDKDGNIVGMWFVGIYSNVLYGKANTVLNNIRWLQIIFILLGTIAAYLSSVYIAKSFQRIKADLADMENGNFHIIFNPKLAKRKDEIGDITRSFINMQETIGQIISSIKKEAYNIEQSSSILAEGADNVYTSVEDISATTQELSSGMEETAASSQEMNATSLTIEEEIGHVSDKAVNGQEIALEIKKRAGNLKEVALSSQKSAIEIYDNANEDETVNRKGRCN
jgi:methyl-accepting chemotaxis protein